MVFQDAMLYPHMTVRKNLEFPRSTGRTVETARTCGIEHLLDRKPASLSGGELQRAALARAVARRPALLLLDEPLSNLDAPLRLRLRREIKAIQRRLGVATIHVTHDQEEAMALGDRMAVMHAGTIVQVGSPQEVYLHPANRFVAGFVGQPPMNFIHGEIVRAGQALVFADRGDLRIDLTAMLGPRAPRIPVGPSVLGIRPEHLHPSSEGSSPELPLIHAEELSMEALGDQVNVLYRTAAGDQLLARLPSAMADRLNGSRSLSTDPRHIHLFEGDETGGNMLLEP
jgi:multiple sugar transport system ATP-binding protein